MLLVEQVKWNSLK